MLDHFVDDVIQSPKTFARLPDQEAAFFSVNTEIDRVGVLDVINGRRASQPFQQGFDRLTDFLDLGLHVRFGCGVCAAQILRALY